MPRIHDTLSGHRIEYPDPGPELEAFLRRAQAMADDPTVKEGELIALVYGTGNPIMDKGVMPGRGAVTREVLDNPVYGVMGDLIFRKEVQQRGIDVGRIAARFALTADEVAERKGVHVSAVTKAAAGRRVASWVKAGRYYFDPNTLATMEFAKPRGPTAGVARSRLNQAAAAMANPTPPMTTRELIEEFKDVFLAYRVGHENDAILRLRYQDLSGRMVEPDSKRAPVVGELHGWSRAAVLHGRQGKLRMFVLEPGAEEAELSLGKLFVRGTFTTARKVNGAKAAEEAWVQDFQLS